MMGGYNDGMGWWMLWGGLMMVLFWGGLFLAVYWIFGAARSNRSGVSSPERREESAEEIAGRRLATGEINEEEFDRIMARLVRSDPA